MRAAVFRGPGALAIEAVDEPSAGPGELVVDVRACAVCGSDLRILGHGNPRIAPPRVLGHEIAGEVVAVGDGVEGFALGDRVSTGADVPCGECGPCSRGRPNNCATNLAIGYQWDGGFAERVRLDRRVVAGGPLRRFGPGTSWVAASLAEPLACCLNGYEVVGGRAAVEGAEVVIFGAGPIGVMLAVLGRAWGAARVTLVEPLVGRRASAEPFADAVLGVEEAEEAVLGATEGRGADLLFTACPSVEAQEAAVRLVAVRGAVNLFGGLPSGTRPMALDSNWLHYREATLTGSHGSTPAQHAEALRRIEAGEIDVESLVTDRVDLDGLVGAMEKARRGEALKIVVEP